MSDWAKLYVEHLIGESTHTDRIGKHYPPCPECLTTRWHGQGCATLDPEFIASHRVAIDTAYQETKET